MTSWTVAHRRSPATGPAGLRNGARREARSVARPFGRLLRRTLTVALACLAASGVAAATPAAGQGTQPSPDVAVYAPLMFDDADIDEQVRFSWSGRNDQDFYRVVFSQYRTYGWEQSTMSTPQTVLEQQFASPREVGLTPGTWYWRVCYGWNEYPDNCYLDDDIRQLDVTETPVLSMAQAISTTRRVVRHRYGKTPRVRCARVDESNVLCRGDFTKRRRARVAVVEVEARSDGIYYSVRLRR